MWMWHVPWVVFVIIWYSYLCNFRQNIFPTWQKIVQHSTKWRRWTMKTGLNGHGGGGVQWRQRRSIALKTKARRWQGEYGIWHQRRRVTTAGGGEQRWRQRRRWRAATAPATAPAVVNQNRHQHDGIPADIGGHVCQHLRPNPCTVLRGDDTHWAHYGMSVFGDSETTTNATT